MFSNKRILDLVCSFSDQSTLAALSCVNQWVHSRASEVLWHTLYSPSPLLGLLKRHALAALFPKCVTPVSVPDLTGAYAADVGSDNPGACGGVGALHLVCNTRQMLEMA
jgi:hypothetical protein